MDKLTEFQCFLKVAAAGSFTEAAAALGITPSGASKQVKSLEARLGARLFNRTTRHVALTEVGRAFRERIEPVLAGVEEAELAVTQLSDEPRGLLRVGAPMDFGRAHLSEPIAAFRRFSNLPHGSLPLPGALARNRTVNALRCSGREENRS